MLNILLLIILSPLAIICGIISIAIIYAIIKRIVELILGTVNSIRDIINKRDET